MLWFEKLMLFGDKKDGEQLIDDQFQADTTLYYEDIDFTKSTIKKNSYAFLPELMIENLDEVKFYLSDWTYPIN